ncbi:MAG: hypothetical protein V8R80_12950 [Eubacterium sp.]
MKKKIVASLMVAALAFSMAACGNKADNKAPAGDAQASAEQEQQTPAEPEQEPTEQPADTAGDAEIKSTGPNGEQGVSADTITLTDEQIAKVKEGNYKVAIVFHYAGNDWSTAQQQVSKIHVKSLVWK